MSKATELVIDPLGDSQCRDVAYSDSVKEKEEQSGEPVGKSEGALLKKDGKTVRVSEGC